MKESKAVLGLLNNGKAGDKESGADTSSLIYESIIVSYTVTVCQFRMLGMHYLYTLAFYWWF